MAAVTESTLKDWIGAWNSHDVEKIASYYADDSLSENVPRAPSRNKSELKRTLRSTFTDYPDFKIESKSVIISGNWAAGEIVYSATQKNNTSRPEIPATGKKYSARGAWFAEWENGKVKRHSVYSDQLTILQQLGLMPGAAPK